MKSNQILINLFAIFMYDVIVLNIRTHICSCEFFSYKTTTPTTLIICLMNCESLCIIYTLSMLNFAITSHWKTFFRVATVNSPTRSKFNGLFLSHCRLWDGIHRTITFSEGLPKVNALSFQNLKEYYKKKTKRKKACVLNQPWTGSTVKMHCYREMGL